MPISGSYGEPGRRATWACREIGNFVLPRTLLKPRSHRHDPHPDARMSGTGFGTVVMHVAPEAATGGALAPVRTGTGSSWTSLPAR
jgi:hypothetical protein